MANSADWYIVQRDSGHCEIVPGNDLGTAATPESSGDDSWGEEQSGPGEAELKTWGPFASEGEAIARRIGLIRSGKCKPV